jgi:hypothetical protein
MIVKEIKIGGQSIWINTDSVAVYKRGDSSYELVLKGVPQQYSVQSVKSEQAVEELDRFLGVKKVCPVPDVTSQMQSVGGLSPEEQELEMLKKQIEELEQGEKATSAMKTTTQEEVEESDPLNEIL